MAFFFVHSSITIGDFLVNNDILHILHHPLAILFLTGVIPYAIWRIPHLKKYFPLVVIQIAAGIALGPSVFGQFAPDVFQEIFPKQTIELVGIVGQYAVYLFIFITGMHIDVSEIASKRCEGRAFIVTSLSSLLVPFMLALGVGFGVAALSPEFMGSQSTMLTFAFAFATALGVTALPVLSATVKDMGLYESGSRAGKLSVACATVNDILLWVLLAVLVSLAQTKGREVDLSGIARLVFSSVVYLVLMFRVIRPLLAWMHTRGKKSQTIFFRLDRRVSDGQLTFVSALIVCSALATEYIGLHALLGAFVAGVIIPKDIITGIQYRMEQFVSCFLLGFFFMSTGLKMTVTVNSTEIWMLCIIATLVSTIGKLVGTVFPAKLMGLHRTWRGALTIGGFMQCKGLMEVVVLTMMLDAKIISFSCFAALILMALVTTAITKPFVLVVRHYFPAAPDEDIPCGNIREERVKHDRRRSGDVLLQEAA
jgi:Kef-type K+ transport system membrane component KefB